MTGSLPTPSKVRLEASSCCQLHCRSCPISRRRAFPTLRAWLSKGEKVPVIGRGWLRFADFKGLVDGNPGLKTIELSNYGEIFLNPELLEIIEYAAARGVTLTADNGVNFNTVSDAVLEGLVRYRFGSLSVSIDGATDSVYRRYRLGGSLPTVLDNLRKLHQYKERYGSPLPTLQWQFVVFGHNEHEIAAAKELARAFNMEFFLKLSWDRKFSPLRHPELLRREVGVASHQEFRELFGYSSTYGICHQLWDEPQINWDGRVLGCCCNYWGDFGGNVFRDGLEAALNHPRLLYAREMLAGRCGPRPDIPCSSCGIYSDLKKDAKWLSIRETLRTDGRLDDRPLRRW